MKIPVSQTNVSSLGVESFVYFDEMRREGKLTGIAHGQRESSDRAAAAGRRVPAAAAAAHDDDDGPGRGDEGRRRVSRRVERGRRRRRARPRRAIRPIPRRRGGDPPVPAGARRRSAGADARGDPARGARRRRGRRRRTRRRRWRRAGNPAQRHSTMANLACYPAMNVPNGFTAAGIPTNATFFARPFGEMELIALAKAYQDVAKHHTRRPEKMDQ